MILDVSAEYASTGLWRGGPDHAIEMLEHMDIDMPSELSHRFNDWIELYWLMLPIEIRGISPRESDRVSMEQFDEIGRGLARDLKTFVGPDVIVRYAPEVRSDPSAKFEIFE